MLSLAGLAIAFCSAPQCRPREFALRATPRELPLHAAQRGALALQASRANVHHGALTGTALRSGSSSMTAAAPPAGVLLAITIALEVSATTCMKLASRGSPWWNVGVYGGYILCFSIFPSVLKQIPLGIAYAIWSGAGTAITALIGALAFGEVFNTRKGLSMALIILGVVGLNLTGTH